MDGCYSTQKRKAIEAYVQADKLVREVRKFEVKAN